MDALTMDLIAIGYVAFLFMYAVYACSEVDRINRDKD